MSHQVKVDDYIIRRIREVRAISGTCGKMRGCLLETAMNTLIHIERIMAEVEFYVEKQEADMDREREREAVDVRD